MQNDFEKSVREKMEELKFVPTAPVWTGIEAQIRRKKDRRWLIIWLPLLCLLLAGGIFWINNTRQQKDAVVPANETSTQASYQEKQFSSEPSSINADANKNSGILNTTTEKNKEQSAGKIGFDQQAVLISEKKFTSPKNLVDLGDRSSHKEISHVQKTKVQSNSNVNKLTINEEASDLLIDKQKTLADPKEIFAEKKIMDAKSEDDTVAKKEEILIADSLNTKEPVQKQLKTGQKWKFVVIAQVGKSGIGEGLNFGGQKEALDPLVSNPNIPFASADHGNAPRKEGLSFSAGMAVSKEIRRRLSFSTGIQYSYYSNTMRIGEDSLSSSTGIRYYLSATPNNSSDYKNSFHFISLPVALEWQIFNRLPLNIRGGLSLQQMISSHALVYSASSQAYVSDRKAFNQMQLFSQLGLNYGFRLRNKSTLQVGPQIQYGLSKMEKNNGNKHLYQVGLNARIVL